MNLRYALGTGAVFSALLLFVASVTIAIPKDPVYVTPMAAMMAFAGLAVWIAFAMFAANRLLRQGIPARGYSWASLAGFVLYMIASTRWIKAPAPDSPIMIHNAEVCLCVVLLAMAILDIILPRSRPLGASSSRLPV